MHYKNRFTIVILFFVIILFSCKSSKTLNSNTSNLSLTTKQLIKENTQKAASFKTLSARVKLDISQGDKENGYTIIMRIEKDKKILLMSSPITVVKALITQDKVSYYNKLDNTYFEGDFKYLSDLLGTELDFKKVQNLLLGEALYGLKDNAFDLSVNESEYILQPKKQNDLFELFYLVSPSLFKISSQQISQPNEHKHLQIDYKSYQEVDKQIVPEHIKVIAVEATEEMILEMEFKAVSLNEDLRFPFKIPSGLHEIKL